MSPHFKIELITIIMDNFFLETHRIRLLRTRVIEGTVPCGQSSPISVSFTMFLRCHFSNLPNYVINHLSYIKKGTQTKT